jgi:hypothetical protein
MSKIESSLKFAKAVCIFGAVFDALTLPPMLLPSVGEKMFGMQNFFPGPDYRYAMNVGASLMLGWTLLLLWAARRPMERAGVLLLTVVVVIGLFAAGMSAVLSGLIPLKNMIPVFVLQSVVMALFSAGYMKVHRLNPGSGSR